MHRPGAWPSTQPVVKVQDLGGNTVVGNTSSVTLTINIPAGAVLACTNATPLPAVAGAATFTGCNIDLPGIYTLHAVDGGLTAANSSSFTITIGGAAKLAFTTSPSDSTGGVAFTTQPVVKVQDRGGNTVAGNTSSVTMTITTPRGRPGGVHQARAPLPAVAGVATFTGCNIDLAGTYTLHAADGALTPATSASVDITVGAAAKLGFTTSPNASTGGTAFTSQPVVGVEDLGGNAVSGDSSSVTLTITTAAGATLTCTNASPLPASAGVATFTGCKINRTGTYTLHAADGSLTAAPATASASRSAPAAKLAYDLAEQLSDEHRVHDATRGHRARPRRQHRHIRHELGDADDHSSWSRGADVHERHSSAGGAGSRNVHGLPNQCGQLVHAACGRLDLGRRDERRLHDLVAQTDQATRATYRQIAAASAMGSTLRSRARRAHHQHDATAPSSA